MYLIIQIDGGFWMRLERGTVRGELSPTSTSPGSHAADLLYFSYVRDRLQISNSVVDVQYSFTSLRVYHLMACAKLAHDTSSESHWTPASCRYVVAA